MAIWLPDYDQVRAEASNISSSLRIAMPLSRPHDTAPGRWRKYLVAAKPKSKSASVTSPTRSGSFMRGCHPQVIATPQIEDRQILKEEPAIRPKPQCMISITVGMQRQDCAHALPRKFPRSNMQPFTKRDPSVCSGHGTQGSASLELWLPRVAVCTVHLADSDARAISLLHLVKISERALAIKSLAIEAR